MIHRHELISDLDWEKSSVVVQMNLPILLHRLNSIRTVYGKPMVVSSGVRSSEKHRQIYEDINTRRVREGKELVKVPWKSWHLYGAAADIYDPFCSLQKWIHENIEFVEEIGLWMESFEHTTSWVHFQIHPPKSMKRFFFP